MPYISCTTNRIFAIRWTGPPGLADADGVLRDARAAARPIGARRSLLVVIPTDVDLPEAEVRHRMQALMPELVLNFESVNLVVEGGGVLSSLFRTFLRGMVLATRGPSKPIFHASVEDALSCMQPQSSGETEAVMRSLVESGICQSLAASSTGSSALAPP